MTELVSMTASELTEKEKAIERGKHAFVTVGLALMNIRDRRGYRLAAYETFEMYCRERWGWASENVTYYIGAARVAETLTQVSSLDYSQARELARLAAPAENGDKRKKVIDAEAVKQVAATLDFSKATVKQVARAVDAHISNGKRSKQTQAALDRAAPLDAERYRLIHADVADGMAQLDVHSIDVIITDPPNLSGYDRPRQSRRRAGAWRTVRDRLLMVADCAAKPIRQNASAAENQDGRAPMGDVPVPIARLRATGQPV